MNINKRNKVIKLLNKRFNYRNYNIISYVLQCFKYIRTIQIMIIFCIIYKTILAFYLEYWL